MGLSQTIRKFLLSVKACVAANPLTFAFLAVMFVITWAIQIIVGVV